jgi:hypothetical protein
MAKNQIQVHSGTVPSVHLNKPIRRLPHQFVVVAVVDRIGCPATVAAGLKDGLLNVGSDRAHTVAVLVIYYTGIALDDTNFLPNSKILAAFLHLPTSYHDCRLLLPKGHGDGSAWKYNRKEISVITIICP